MDSSQKLITGGDILENLEKYRQLVRKLNYLTVTRPDITFPVSVVQCSKNPCLGPPSASLRPKAAKKSIQKIRRGLGGV